MKIYKLNRPTIVSVIFALIASALPLTTTSCDTPGGRNAFAGGIGGAAIGGLIGGRRGALAGAITGGILGAATTPNYQQGYYPSRPRNDVAYRNYR